MREAKPWGDGFANDGWRVLFSVRDWSQVSPDELVRLYPALVPAAETVPERIKDIVSARTAEIEAGRGRRAGTDGRRVFAAAPPCDDVAFLRSAIDRGPANHASERDMARFAILTGMHPAYVWPAAAALAEWGAAAAWLGVLSRRRAALMPGEVADYFFDVLVPTAGAGVIVNDKTLAEFVVGIVKPENLLRAVRKRRAGLSVTVIRNAVGSEEHMPWSRLSRGFSRFWLARRPATAAETHAP